MGAKQLLSWSSCLSWCEIGYWSSDSLRNRREKNLTKFLLSECSIPYLEDVLLRIDTHIGDSEKPPCWLVDGNQSSGRSCRFPNQAKDTAKYSHQEADHEPSHRSKNAQHRESQ